MKIVRERRKNFFKNRPLRNLPRYTPRNRFISHVRIIPRSRRNTHTYQGTLFFPPFCYRSKKLAGRMNNQFGKIWKPIDSLSHMCDALFFQFPIAVLCAWDASEDWSNPKSSRRIKFVRPKCASILRYDRRGYFPLDYDTFNRESGSVSCRR